MATELTPCGALFETMKRYGGISHKDLARLVLSGRPLADGKSPLSRCDDRTWVSRFIVHAPVGSLQDRYFCDWGVAALRVSARLRSRDGKGLSAEEALSLVTNQGGALMEQALRECHQEDLALYRNVLERLARGAGYSVEERSELAMVLFVAAGCSANVKRACAYVLDYVKTVHGGRLETVPAAVMDQGEQSDAPSADPREQAQALGLLRMVGGLVSGGLHWVQPLSDGVEIGALALGPDDINDVEPDVSGHHLRIWCNEAGRWCVQGLGELQAAAVLHQRRRRLRDDGGAGARGRFRMCRTGRGARRRRVGLGRGSTRFMLIEGMPESWEEFLIPPARGGAAGLGNLCRRARGRWIREPRRLAPTPGDSGIPRWRCSGGEDYAALDIVDEALDICLACDLQRRGDAAVGAMADRYRCARARRAR